MVLHVDLRHRRVADEADAEETLPIGVGLAA